MFDIANVPFTLVGPEEVGRYAADLKDAANYQGYKGRQVWVGCVQSFEIPCTQADRSHS